MNAPGKQIEQRKSASPQANTNSTHPLLSTQHSALGTSEALTTHHSPPTGRRQEIDAKQEMVAGLLAEAGADGLLVLDPANIAWLTCAPLCQGYADPAEWPALFFLA